VVDGCITVYSNSKSNIAMAPIIDTSFDGENFDVISTYNNLLKTDPEVTMPVATIRALLKSLESHPTTTAAETLDHLQSQTSKLIASQPNQLPLIAGSDLFKRYIIFSIERAGATRDFRLVREQLITNGEQLAVTAKRSRERIAKHGRQLIKSDETILTVGGSRVVGELLLAAAAMSSGPPRFRVLYVLADAAGAGSEGLDVAARLREKNIPTATISINTVAHVMGQRRVNMVIVGAETVVQNGGVMSRMGTSVVASVAKQNKIPFYVAAESQKFVRWDPNDKYEVPIRQRIVKYTAIEDGKMEEIEDNVVGLPDLPEQTNAAEFVDFTEPEYITRIITENGPMLPGVVSLELMKMWN